jgi:hypothetical protein
VNQQLVFTIVFIAATPFAAATAERCLHPRVDAAVWLVTRSPRLPGLTLRTPPGFARDPAEDSYAGSPPSGSRWATTTNDQLVLTRLPPDSVLAPLPTAASRPEYSRCSERIGLAIADIVSYKRRDEVGDMAYVGPYQVHARLSWADGMRVEVYGMAEDRAQYVKLLAAIRTIRRADSKPPAT